MQILGDIERFNIPIEYRDIEGTMQYPDLLYDSMYRLKNNSMWYKYQILVQPRVNTFNGTSM